MKLLSFLLIIMILASGFVQPPATPMKLNAAKVYMMKHHSNKGDCCNKNKRNTSNTFCNFCMLCIAYIVPDKAGIQRNFVSGMVDYPNMVHSKLTDFNSSPWRPPNA